MKLNRAITPILLILISACSQQHIDTVKASKTQFAQKHNIGDVLDKRTQCSSITWDYSKDEDSNRIVTYKCKLNHTQEWFTQYSQNTLESIAERKPNEETYHPKIVADVEERISWAHQAVDELKETAIKAELALNEAESSRNPNIVNIRNSVERAIARAREAEAGLPSEIRRLEEYRDAEIAEAKEERAIFEKYQSLHTQALAELGDTIETISWVINDEGAPILQSAEVGVSFSGKVLSAPLISLDIHIVELINKNGKTGSEFGALLKYIWDQEIKRRQIETKTSGYAS